MKAHQSSARPTAYRCRAAPSQSNPDAKTTNEANATRDAELEFLRSQKELLEDCLRVCASAKTGVHVKHAEATDDAKQLIGNIGKVEPGGPAVEVEKAIAKMRARQVVGSTDGAFAQEFLK